MLYQGFTGPTGAARSASADCSRTINLYLEPSSSNPREFVLYSLPGLKPVDLLESAPVRGLYTTSGGRVFATTSTTLYELFAGWTHLSRGTIVTGTEATSFADNGIHMVLTTQGQGYSYDLATNVLAALPTTGPAQWGQVAYLDGYLLTNEVGTRRFWYSAPLDATTWPATNFYSAEARPDIITTLFVDHRELWIFGSQSIEVWFSTGDALSPFARNQSVMIEQGIASPWAVSATNNTIYLLGGTPRGQGPVWRLNGYTPERVSTHSLETAMGRMGVVSDAISFTASQGGHPFVVFAFPTGQETWAYDTNTGAWAEWPSLEDDGTFSAYPSYVHCSAFGAHLFGDRTTGRLYTWADDWHRYGQKARYCARVGPFIRQENERFRLHKVELLGEMGVGLDGAVIPGADPQLRLAITEDGQTFGYERWTSAGRLGQRTRRAVWRQCGQHRSAAIRIACTDPVPLAWRAVSLEVS